MRSKKQIAVRVQRAAIANELLAWFKKKDEENPISGYRGAYLSYPYIEEFCREKNRVRFEVWKAWDLLKEAGRLNLDHRHGWKVLNFTPIALDENGDLARDV